MSWVKQSDTLWRDVEFMKLSDGAQALWMRANSYSADQLTDGHIPASAIKLLRTRTRYVQELVTAGYWTPCDAGGWLATGWQETIRSKAQVLAKRAEQKQRDRARSANQSAALLPPPVPNSQISTETKEIRSTTSLTTDPGAAREIGGVCDAALVGYRWLEKTLSDTPPYLTSWRAEYAAIGAKPEAERAAVAQHAMRTPYIAAKKSKATPGHLLKFWAAFVEGPRTFELDRPSVAKRGFQGLPQVASAEEFARDAAGADPW